MVTENQTLQAHWNNAGDIIDRWLEDRRLYNSDAAEELLRVDPGGPPHIRKNKNINETPSTIYRR